MSGSALGGRERRAGKLAVGVGNKTSVPQPRRFLVSDAGSNGANGLQCSYVDLGDSTRVALMIVPHGRGSFPAQAQEVLAAMRRALGEQRPPMTVTVQTVFLRDPGDQAECERILAAFHGARRPVTNFVNQPPCCGAALAMEVWAIGGESVSVVPHGPNTLVVSYDSVRWVYCAGIMPVCSSGGVYPQASDALERMRKALAGADSSFEHVVRTWYYLGGITEQQSGLERYQELNRARSDFYREIHFSHSLPGPNNSRGAYPASTGIGMSGEGLVLGCLALETRREDVRLLPLENPRQTPAYVYHSRYSPRSPKFSRAMALVLGDYVTTWVSGTASILESESRYPGDVEKQTEQTIDNIERLIGADNFARHGMNGAGASLRDMAKIRVYIKRPEDFEKCRAICTRRFGGVPAIYAKADICRPELLVEIEGVAFSRCSTQH